MNKYQESLKRIEEVNPSYIDGGDIELLQKLVDRATPKKPFEDLESPIRYVKTYACPNCHNKFTGSVSIFCYHCGQALDWSEE